ncbi:hypothetical protein [Mycobacteroides abscessus]|uniref:hypothetical protein n=1 Tax=Mycobacteroides abscessus TaxID=36809 RepID=UPI0009A6956C|nr:hypothetical protein [Mycobacteroides abscessus]
MWGIPRPQRLVDGASEWWRYLEPRQAAGYICACIGIVLTIVTAVVPGGTQLLIAIIAAFVQGFAAFSIASHGKAHPSLARSAFGRLVSLAQKVKITESAVQTSFENKQLTVDERQTQMGILSNDLGWIGEGIYNAAADWLAFNQPLIELINEDQRKEIMTAAKEAKSAAETGVDISMTGDAAQQAVGGINE